MKEYHFYNGLCDGALPDALTALDEMKLEAVRSESIFRFTTKMSQTRQLKMTRMGNTINPKFHQTYMYNSHISVRDLKDFKSL